MDLLLTHGYFLRDDPQEQRIMKPYPPLGLLYLSSHLKAAGFGVEVLDSTFASFDAFVKRLREERPSVVGIYCNLMTKTTVLRMVEECRRHGSAVILGGPEPAYYAEAYLDHGADFVVVGEGELTLAELLPRLVTRPGSRDLADVAGLVYRDEHGKHVRTPPRGLIPKLDAQPWPDREAIDIGLYVDAWRGRHGMGSVSVLTARGCPYTCRWCSRSVFGETHRRRSPENVADEVEWIVARYRPDMLWYVDDVFTIHHGFVFKYAEEMARRGLRIPFECISRADRVNEEVADALARLGCFRVWIGSESGSQRILDAMDRRVTVEQIRQASRALKAQGIQVGMFIMLGYPGEDTGDIEATVEHLKKTAPDVFLTTVAYPIKGTPFHDEVGDRLANPGSWAAWSDRDLRILGRQSRLYYRFARDFVEWEVARDRHWKERRYFRAARAATRACAGRVGMALLGQQRES
jgi:radical SAM superfamily enzyme YgiQ (UPF0313 family)